MHKYKLLSTLLPSLLFISVFAQADTVNDDCVRAIKNSPNKPHTYCRGYTKGYKAAGGSSTTGSGTGVYQRETIVYGRGKPDPSTTEGVSLKDKIAVTLDPGFKDRKAAGELSWAGISDLKLQQAIKTKTTTQPNRTDMFTLQQSQMSVQDYVKNGGKQNTIEQLEEKIKGLDNNTAYTIYLQRSD